jgi:hypothetical protein
MKLYTHEDMLDRVVGKKGTPDRDAMEAELRAFLRGGIRAGLARRGRRRAR